MKKLYLINFSFFNLNLKQYFSFKFFLLESLITQIIGLIN